MTEQIELERTYEPAGDLADRLERVISILLEERADEREGEATA